MRRPSLSPLRLGCLLLVLGCGPASEAPAPTPGEALAAEVADAVGLSAWRELSHLRFTWRHVPKGIERTYEWTCASGKVVVTRGENTVEIPRERPGPDAGEEEIGAHKAFVNDSYWLLFPLLMTEDGSEKRDLGVQEVPGFPGLGERRALDVRYPAEGGYTPGDRYVLYLGDDHRPVAWAFHRGGAEEPTLVALRTARREVAGLSLPTRFEAPGGKLLIEIPILEAE
jgi:hypothetical protein